MGRSCPVFIKLDEAGTTRTPQGGACLQRHPQFGSIEHAQQGVQGVTIANVLRMSPLCGTSPRVVLIAT